MSEKMSLTEEKQRLASRSRFDTVDLLRIMEILRSPEGCVWDAGQTHASIRANLLEEAYEAAEGIDLQDSALLCEELGDLLLQVVFHARIAEEAGEFTYGDIVSGVCRKLIVRHPHVFGGEQIGSADEMLDRWEEIKAQTKQRTTLATDMESVAKTLPALTRAQKLAKKAMRNGAQVPMGEALSEEALGEALFALCATAQTRGIDAEEALRAYENRLIARVKEAEG